MNSPMTQSDLLKIIADQKEMMDKMQAALEAKSAGPGFRIKVSEKGCLTLGGGRIRRFGCTLYITEWETIVQHIDEIKAFVKANDHLFSRKSA